MALVAVGKIGDFQNLSHKFFFWQGGEDLSQFLIGAHAAELSAGDITTNYVLLKSTCNRLSQR